MTDWDVRDTLAQMTQKNRQRLRHAANGFERKTLE